MYTIQIRRNLAWLIASFFALFAFTLALPASAATATYYVDGEVGTDDPAKGTGTGTDAWATIEYAIGQVANPTTDDITINVAADTYTTSNDEIGIDRNFANLIISGDAANTTIVQSHADPDSSTARVFNIGSSEHVTLENMTIQHGRTTSTGAGVYQSSSGSLTINDVVIYDNDGTTSFDYGGVYSNSDLVVSNSTFYDNDSQYAAALGGGGSSTTVEITNSTFFNNDGSTAAIYFNGPAVTVTNSLFAQGDEFLLQGSNDAYFKNSVLIDSDTTYDLEYYNFFGTVIIENSIIGNEDTDGAAPYAIDGTDGNIVVGGDYTLEQLGLKEAVSINDAANGVLTAGIYSAGSLVIDAGDSDSHNGVSIPSTDQRGKSRVSTTDIGPFEWQGSEEADPAFSSISLASDNSYVDITFDEGVYDSGGAGVDAGDFSISFTQNGGDATDVAVSSTEQLDGAATVGGETTIRLNLSVTGTSNGLEYFSVSPASSTAIEDASGNTMLASAETSSVTLNGATHYYVRADGNDSNDGSADNSGDAWLTIQHAVDTVSNPTTDPIVINVSGDTYDLNNDDVSIDRGFVDLTIRGTGADSTVIQAHNDPASATDNIFVIGGGEYVTIEDMTLEHGRTSGSYDGAAIDATSSGSLTINRVQIEDNDAGSSSAAVVTQSDITVTDSTFTGNNGSYTGAILASNSNKTASISNSTFFENTGSSGGVYFNGYNLTVINSISTQGSKFFIQGSYDTYIKNSVFADGASGYDIDYYNYFGTLYAENTILGTEDTDGAAPYVTDGENGNTVVGEDTLTDLGIATSLADNSTVNGTQTLSISAGSDVIDAGDTDAVNGTTIPLVDQRGANRSGAVDIGPFEYNGVVDGPYVTSFYPAEDGTAVPIDSNLLIQFSEAVTAQSGDITIYKNDDTLVEAFDVTSDISGSGTSEISINPSSNLNSENSYYVQIDATAFDDASSNSYEGITDETTWTFTTSDITAPTIETLSPNDDSTGEVVDTDLVLTFVENVNPVVGQIAIYNVSNDEVVESIDVNSSAVTGGGTHEITVDPASDLDALVGYYVHIDASAFEDDEGNAYAGISDSTTWNFETDGTAGVTTGSVSGDAGEDGTTADFTVVLDTQPTDDVVIGVSSTDTGEGTVSPSSLTFTNANWDSAQTVTVTGVDDDIDDGDIDFDIVLAAASSTDGNYSGLNPADVSVTTTDDDTAAVNVSAIPVLVTEGGSVDDIRIVLDTEPTADVVVAMTDDNGEVTMASSITFTSENWDEQQNVQVTAIDDDVDEDSEDGSVSFTVTSSDGNYSGYSVSNKAVDVTDNDTAGVTVGLISGSTTEAGGTATFTVVLDTEPTADVTIGVTSDDTDEGTVSPSSLTFTSGNWDTTQTVTVTGVDDADDDGNQTFDAVLAAASSSDGNYDGLDPSDVTVTNVDDDLGSVTVSAVSGAIAENGSTATFTVVLDEQPTHDVTFAVSSSDTGEGTVSPSSLTFTNGNWDTAQTVTVTGVDDDIDDSNVGFTIILGAATSTDTNFNTVDPADVSVTNVDDDTAQVTVNPAQLTVEEGTLVDGLYIVLETEPTDDVVFNFTLTENEVTLESSSMTFTSENWDTMQDIEVTAIDDNIAEGEHTDVINWTVTSDDAVYGAIDPYYRGVTIADNDTAGITASAMSDNPNEDGDAETFTVVLDTEPTADVTVPVSSSDTGEGTVSPSSLTFTSGNWDTAQTVTVTGVNDDAADGDQDFSAVIGAATSEDDMYDELDAEDVSVTNEDNDTGSVTVSAVSGTISEAGDTATFSIWPDERPESNIYVEVELPISVSDPTQASVSPSSIWWTSTSWNGPQLVTITALDDDIDDGDVSVDIVLGEISIEAADNYDGYDAPDFAVTLVDNDTAGITISETVLAVTEGGTTDSFDVVLDTEPTEDVVLGFTRSTSDIRFSADSFTFTSENWDTAQTLTVTAVDDEVVEDTETAIISMTVTSDDENYDEFELDVITTTVNDNDEEDETSSEEDPVNDVDSGEGDGSGDSEENLGKPIQRTRLDNGLIEVEYQSGATKVFKMFNMSAKPKAVLHTNKDVVIAITKKYMRTYDAYTGERLDQVKLFNKKQAYTKMKRFNIYTNTPGQNNVVVLGRYKVAQKKKVNMRSFVVENNGQIVRRNIQRIELQRNTKFSKLNVTKNKKSGKQAVIRLIRKKNIVHAYKYHVTKQKGKLVPVNQ